MILSLLIGFLTQLTGDFIKDPAVLEALPSQIVGELDYVKDDVDEVLYAFKSRRANLDGIVSLTSHSFTEKLVGDNYRTTIFAGSPQYYQEENGDWYQLDYATTTLDNFEKQMTPTLLDRLKIQNVLAASPETYYPSAGDGHINADNANWATLRGASSGSATYNESEYVSCVAVVEAAGSYYLNRCFFPFDTSALPDDADITDVVMSVYSGTSTGDSEYGVFDNNQVANTTLDDGDFDQVGFDLYSDTSTASVGYNDYTFNATGLATINVSGWSNYAVLDYTHDALNVAPNASEGARLKDVRFSEYADTSSDPKLVITYGDEEPPEEPPAGTLGSTTMATSTTGTISDLVFGQGIIITMLFLMVIGFMFNNLNQKKPWR